jgi:hypothetical protein
MIWRGSLPALIFSGGRVTDILVFYELTSPTLAIPRYVTEVDPSTSLPSGVRFSRR